MIRFLFLLLVFVGGLAGAAAWFGEIHHLRRAMPDTLPGWTQDISARSGLRNGQIELRATGVRPALTLHWTARRPDTDGLLWDVRLVGQGVDITAELLVPYWPQKALIRNGAGGVLLADLPGVQAKGLVVLSDLTGEISDLVGTRQMTGALSAQARGISVSGTDLGDGPVTASLSADGRWQAQATLQGGTGPLGATLVKQGAMLDIALTGTDALPPAVRQPLQRFGRQDGDALRFSLPFGL